MSRNLITLFLFLSASLFSWSAFAKSINLYDEPKDNAKVLSTLDSDVGIIPIFTPEKSEWIKVADPRNGNVGWVKSKDLGGSNSTEYTFTQRYINTGNSPQSYQIIQFGSPNKMTVEQMKEQLKQTEKQQQELQQNINKSMQNMINEMNSLYHWNMNTMPFVMPVIVIPAQNLPGAEKPVKKSKAAETTKDSKLKKKSLEDDSD